MRTQRKVSQICLLPLALLLLTPPSSATNNTTATTSASPAAALRYSTRPTNLTVAVGEPAVFRCGVPKESSNLTMILYSSHGNYSLTCPQGHMEDIPQALYGSCEEEGGESLAVWTLKGTSYSDNGTRVVCQQLGNPLSTTAVLRVYDNGTNYAILIGCTIGGFFGILLVFALLFMMLQRSETLQECFRGKQTEEDMTTIVEKE